MEEQTLQILIVEDHPGVRSILGKFLHCLGHSVALACDADSALQRLAEQKFDVLLIDVGLPDRNAWHLIAEVRARGHLPPLLVSMSAHNTGTEAVRSKAAGCQAHLHKPFVAERLEELLKTAVKHQPSKLVVLPPASSAAA